MRAKGDEEALLLLQALLEVRKAEAIRGLDHQNAGWSLLHKVEYHWRRFEECCNI